MKRILFLLMLVTLSLSCALTVSAQSTEDLDKMLSVELSPEIPGPYQSVDVSIESYVYDLSHAKISWYVNGALKASEYGKTTFTFTTADVGIVSTIKYTIETQDGISFDKTLSVVPGEVNLIWESQGYIPPFYKGKSLFSFEGTARIVAVPNLLAPNGTKYKPEELVYTWKRGMGTDTEASGYGKNVFYFTGDIVARPAKIQVEVSDLKNTTHAKSEVTISTVEPELHVYENSPALGVLFNRAITGRFNMLENESSFIAEPFYFNNPDQEGEYTWSVNGQNANEKSRYITFRNANQEEGISKIGIDLSNQKRILQSTNIAFDISFGSNSGSSMNNLFKNIFGN